MIEFRWPKLAGDNRCSIWRIMLGKNLIIIVAMLLPLSCSTRSKTSFSDINDAHTEAGIQFNVNSKAAELLYAWFDDPADDETARKLTVEPGTQIMAVCAQAAMPGETLPAFGDELARFKTNPNSDKDPYHIHRAWQQRHESARLLAQLKAFDFTGHVTKRVTAYIPDAQRLDLTCNLYFVLTGWKWGDAMFTGVEKVGDTYKLSGDGQPTAIINLAIMTELFGQDKKPEAVVEHVAENIVHECFHLAYSQCQSQVPRRRSDQDSPELARLVELIQNEGMAHYISHQQAERLVSGYDQTEKLKKYERQAFKQLGEAVADLADPNVDADKKQQLFASGTSGNYWSKFVCISGMFMAYHIERLAGRQALRETVSGGGPAFLRMYQKVQKAEPSLPKLPPELESYCHRAGNDV